MQLYTEMLIKLMLKYFTGPANWCPRGTSYYYKMKLFLTLL